MVNKKTHQQQKKEKNPWILAESDMKKKLDQEVARLIHDAIFIPKEKEKNWTALLPYFSENFLKELKNTIIRENLRHLSTKNKKKH